MIFAFVVSADRVQEKTAGDIRRKTDGFLASEKNLGNARFGTRASAGIQLGAG